MCEALQRRWPPVRDKTIRSSSIGEAPQRRVVACLCRRRKFLSISETLQRRWLPVCVIAVRSSYISEILQRRWLPLQCPCSRCSLRPLLLFYPSTSFLQFHPSAVSLSQCFGLEKASPARKSREILAGRTVLAFERHHLPEKPAKSWQVTSFSTLKAPTSCKYGQKCKRLTGNAEVEGHGGPWNGAQRNQTAGPLAKSGKIARGYATTRNSNDTQG